MPAATMRYSVVRDDPVETQGYLTTEEIARQLNISVFTVRRYIRTGKLKAVKLEGGYRVRRQDFEQFLREREFRQPL